jgi:hypothetical protein
MIILKMEIAEKLLVKGNETKQAHAVRSTGNL